MATSSSIGRHAFALVASATASSSSMVAATPSPEVRYWAVCALRELGDASVIPTLQRLEVLLRAGPEFRREPVDDRLQALAEAHGSLGGGAGNQ